MTRSEIAAGAFQILAKISAESSTITYGELGKRIGIHHRPVPGALGVIWDWCDGREYPPLNALVVNKKTGMPGGAFAPGGRSLRRDRWLKIVKEVHQFKWDKVEGPDLS